MRIIGGLAGGWRIKVPAAGTRPTSDRVREALFSMLERYVDFDGAHVLDLYAGSGALGLESLSRGAAKVDLVEADRRAASIVTANVVTLGLNGARVHQRKVARYLAGAPESGCDLVFLDPPYDLADDAVLANVTALLDQRWLANEAVVVVERSARSPETAWPDGYREILSRAYGDTRVDLAVVDAAATV